MTITVTPTFEAELEDRADKLQREIAASRVNIRLETTEEYPIVAEAVADGVKRHKSMSFPAMRGLPTFKFVAERRTALIQDDTREGEAAWAALYDNNRLISQVLWPILEQGAFVGFVAVHHIGDEPRRWSDEDKQAIERVVEAVQADLEKGVGR